MERADVLPVLLEQRDQEVDSQHDIGGDLVFSHVDVADSDTEAENLLELELDGALDFGDLVVEVLSVRDGSRELSGCTGIEFQSLPLSCIACFSAPLTLGETGS